MTPDRIPPRRRIVCACEGRDAEIECVPHSTRHGASGHECQNCGAWWPDDVTDWATVDEYIVCIDDEYREPSDDWRVRETRSAVEGEAAQARVWMPPPPGYIGAECERLRQRIEAAVEMVAARLGERETRRRIRRLERQGR